MPRSRARPEFSLGEQWIAREPGRPGYYRFWNDPSNGRTRRASLRTGDLELAKNRLAEIVVRGERKNTNSLLAVVLETYFADKTDHQVSGGSARNAGRLLLKSVGNRAKAGMMSNDAQVKEFVRRSLSDTDHAISTVARNLGVVAAAFRHSKLEVQFPYSEGAILAKWPEFKPKPVRKLF